MKQLLTGMIFVLLLAAGASYAAPNIDMVLVKGGCFQMGDTFGDGRTDEKPVHEVCLSDFYIGRYLVTQAEWTAVMGKNPSLFIGDGRPVDSVSWNDAQEFIATLNELTGKGFRLPTEAEWEYAARSGGIRERWAGTSDEKQLGDYAWYRENSGERTHLVGRKKPNGAGLYDMSGNLWQWCQDWYGDVYYKESPRDNPQGPASGALCVLRGGSWGSTAEIARVADRNFVHPSSSFDNFGFRLVLPVDPPMKRPRWSISETGAQADFGVSPLQR